MVKLLLAVLILGALFYFVGAAEFIAVFAEIEPVYVIYFFLLAVVMIWASCLKWQLFIRAGGNDAPILHLMKLYTAAYFFNTFTPSFVGGDLARSFHLGRYLGNQREAFVATFLERFTGLLAMALLGVLFVIFGAEATAGLSVAICSVGALTLLIACACFSERFGKMCFGFTRGLLASIGVSPRAKKVLELFGRIEDSMRAARGDKKLLFNALLLSLFFHLLTVINTYLAARAIGWDNPQFGSLFVVVPLVLLVSMLPLTPSGLGLQEGAFLFFLQRIGGTHAQGLAVGLVLRAKVIVIAAVGGLLWLQIRRYESNAPSKAVTEKQ